jgi:hypothetical protein
MDGTFIARAATADSIERSAGATHRMVLGAILLVAIVLRVVAIDAQGLWTDEALTIVLSNFSIHDLLLLPTDPTPALYYILHKLLIPADAPLILVRSISVAAGVISVGALYLLGRMALGATGGLLAAGLLAVWGAHVDYSQEARAYSLLFLLTLLASLGLLSYARLLRQAGDDRRRWLALALFCAGNLLSFYAHVIAVFWIALTSLLLLAVAARRRVRWAELLAAFGFMALGAAPGLLRLARQIAVGDQFHWLGQADLLTFAETNAAVFLPAGWWDNPLTLASGTRGVVEIAVTGASLALLGAGGWIGRARLRRFHEAQPTAFWMIFAYLSVPPLVWATGFIARPLFMERTILLAVPGAILLIVAICLALGPRLGAGAGLAMILAYGGSTLASGIVREKEDWRGANEYLAAAAAPGDVIAVCPLYNYPALRYAAASPVGAAVIGIAGDGSLLEIERGLGGNPSWDKTYFRYLVTPGAAAQRAAAPVRLLALRPGQSIWRVDGHCNTGFSSDLARALDSAGAASVAWRQTRLDAGTFGVAVRRYTLSAPLMLDVLDVAPGGKP